MITRAYAIKQLKNVSIGLRLAMLTNPHLLGMAIGIRDEAPREIAMYAHRRVWGELGLPESALPEVLGKPEAALDILKKYCDEEVTNIMQDGADYLATENTKGE